MARICLDCATPKGLGTGKCIPCGKETTTWDGEPRKPLCVSCQFSNVDGKCNLADEHDFAFPTRFVAITIAEPLTQRCATVEHQCLHYERNHKVSADSPNPLSSQDIDEIKSWLANPSAFWLHPRRWDHVEDPRKDFCWDLPEDKKTPAKAAKAVVFGGLALATGLMKKKKTG